MKILILYHSGAGNTKLIAEKIYDSVRNDFEVEINHIDNKYTTGRLQEFDLLIFGFPTHHAAPSLSMIEFVENLSGFTKPAKAFIFTTYGLYTGNSLRTFARMLRKKNIRILHYAKFRAPATDGVLLFPEKLKFMFRFEKKIKDKLQDFIRKVRHFTNLSQDRLPPYEWYVPLNDLIKTFGIKYYEKLKNQMHILPEACTNCNLCVNVCERQAWTENEPIPVFNSGNCEFCLECVHKCPTGAIVFSDKMKDKKRLNKKFYTALKNEINS